jgi:molybdopterin/thiamine biosynthesis adenylyltransferase
MARRRWWETGERSIEDEAAAFRAAGLAFELDQQLFDANDVVIFRGELRLNERRVPAEVRYPPAYADDEPVVVYAPALPVGRHRSRDGLLCLDHPVLGETSGMGGAEAVQRAERLWWLWENDREQLEAEEAPAPDPRANQYLHDDASAVTLRDIDVDGFDEGQLRINLVSLQPLRGAVTMVNTTAPRQHDFSIDPNRTVLAGGLSIGGFWRRVHEPPRGFDAATVYGWAKKNAADMVEKATGLAEIDRGIRRGAEIPAIVGFVYPDEGPGRGEFHDQWLFLALGHDNSVSLPRPILLREDERWVRQPQLRPLASKKIGIVGVGALGSPLTAMLTRAGVGSHVLVDHDLFLAGNRVRHELDLGDLGDAKVRVMASRMHRIDPWLEQVAIAGVRFGGATSSPAPDVQRLDDEVAQMLSDCNVIVNASAHTATGYHVSRLGREHGINVVHTWVSAGAWGGRVLVQSESSGCTLCLAWAQAEPVEGVDTVPTVTDDPDVVEVLERGCGDPTFTGPGFELVDVAAAAARVVVQCLLDGDGYPGRDFDLVTLNFRDAISARPATIYTKLPIHPKCTICNGR